MFLFVTYFENTVCKKHQAPVIIINYNPFSFLKCKTCLNEPINLMYLAKIYHIRLWAASHGELIYIFPAIFGHSW